MAASVARRWRRAAIAGATESRRHVRRDGADDRRRGARGLHRRVALRGAADSGVAVPVRHRGRAGRGAAHLADHRRADEDGPDRSGEGGRRAAPGRRSLRPQAQGRAAGEDSRHQLRLVVAQIQLLRHGRRVAPGARPGRAHRHRRHAARASRAEGRGETRAAERRLRRGVQGDDGRTHREGNGRHRRRGRSERRRPSRRARRREVHRRHAHHRRGARANRGAQSARAAAQSGERRGHSRDAPAVSRRAARRGVRHGVSSHAAGLRLSLRPALRALREEGRPPLRLPRHVAPLRQPARRAVSEAPSERAAAGELPSRQRLVALRRGPRALGGHDDGLHARRGPHHGHALRRRGRRACSPSSNAPRSSPPRRARRC